jgi:hypothetical protein
MNSSRSVMEQVGALLGGVVNADALGFPVVIGALQRPQQTGREPSAAGEFGHAMDDKAGRAGLAHRR